MPTAGFHTSAVVRAVSRGDVVAVRDALLNGHCPNLPVTFSDRKGNNSLHELVLKCYHADKSDGKPEVWEKPFGPLLALEIARLLLRHGANPNARNDYSQKPLDYADMLIARLKSQPLQKNIHAVSISPACLLSVREILAKSAAQSAYASYSAGKAR